jgi:hypothetical protein
MPTTKGDTTTTQIPAAPTAAGHTTNLTQLPAASTNVGDTTTITKVLVHEPISFDAENTKQIRDSLVLCIHVVVTLQL